MFQRDRMQDPLDHLLLPGYAAIVIVIADDGAPQITVGHNVASARALFATRDLLARFVDRDHPVWRELLALIGA